MYYKKALSPVVAVSLLIVVSVTAVVGFQTWFESYSSDIYNTAQIESSQSINTKISHLSTSKIYLQNNIPTNISSLKIIDSQNQTQICSFNNNIEQLNKLNTDSSLYGWWKFDENSSIIKDSSNNNNNGTLYGGTFKQNCILEGCYHFNIGNYGMINISSNKVFNNNFSLSFWIKSEKDNSYHFFGNRAWGNSNDLDKEGFSIIAFNSPESLSLTINDNSSNDYGEVITRRKFNMTFLSFVKNESKVRLFKNGKLVTQIDSVKNFSSPYNLFIGRNPAGSNAYFSGKFDDIRLYNKTLNESEIKTLYKDSFFSTNQKINTIDISQCNIIRGKKYEISGKTKEQTFHQEIIAK